MSELRLRCDAKDLELLKKYSEIDITKWEHDAAIAHCLMEAIKEVDKVYPYLPGSGKSTEWILERAAEIAKEKFGLTGD